MTKLNNTEIKINIEDLKKDCEDHEQLIIALQTMIEVKANNKAIELIVNEVREKAELIISHMRFIK